MDTIVVELITRLGLPVALLVIVGIYHAKVVRAKDAELARVNELRVTEAQKVSEKMIERDGSYLEMIGAIDKTLTVIGERLSKRGS